MAQFCLKILMCDQWSVLLGHVFVPFLFRIFLDLFIYFALMHNYNQIIRVKTRASAY